MKTIEGVEYILQSSASNPRSIQPKATTELSYLAVIDRTDTVTLSEANWTDVDYYVYPKTETRILAIPISGQSWKGSDMKITDPASVKKWGEKFKIPSLTSPLEYTPVSIDKEVTDKGTIQVLQLLVTNPTDQRETLPEFIIDGKTSSKVFEGQKVVEDAAGPTTAVTGQQVPVTVNAGTSASGSGTADAAASEVQPIPAVLKGQGRLLITQLLLHRLQVLLHRIVLKRNRIMGKRLSKGRLFWKRESKSISTLLSLRIMIPSFPVSMY